MSVLKGSGFKVSRGHGIASHHGLNRAGLLNQERVGKFRSLWIVGRKGAPIKVNPQSLSEHPGIDVTIIRQQLPSYLTTFEVGPAAVDGDEVVMLGYPEHLGGKLEITIRDDHSLSRCRAEKTYTSVRGLASETVVRTGRFDAQTFPAPTRVVSIDPKFPAKGNFIEIGMSGGPLVRYETNQILGMMHQRADTEPRAYAIDVREFENL